MRGKLAGRRGWEDALACRSTTFGNEPPRIDGEVVRFEC